MANQPLNSYIEQSAVIPYRWYQGEIEILLITSSNKKRWIIPKGIIEPKMTPQASAAKEALEEAGVKGKVDQTLRGIYTYEKWGGVCRVQIFLLSVESLYIDWLEASFRQREWVSLEEAINRIKETEIKIVLEKLPLILNQEIS
ncbi:NUDIX hydrolase [Crocosphaera sp. XPORK-15E]|uniref:NUDIX hydrolase n=1 Tax=Crocosphaera sp. XPORK-15E TaxID=3110247 RepID=UPI002B21965A|nr:NUDIX hydrolase [Crocosphaera sp. XPORK-15E]MEA5533255.1 NUDIX hydrolase [Crocosphaera sp. XPORK-15E]